MLATHCFLFAHLLTKFVKGKNNNTVLCVTGSQDFFSVEPKSGFSPTVLVEILEAGELKSANGAGKVETKLFRSVPLDPSVMFAEFFRACKRLQNVSIRQFMPIVSMTESFFSLLQSFFEFRFVIFYRFA